MHPFRFGCQAYRATSGKEWRDTARRAETLGYSTLFVPDHYIGAGPALDPTGHRVQTLASVPAITVAAEVTSTLRVGSRMFCTSYHQPVVLAKEAATIDVLSDGRFELGLGAGWLASEYDAMGIAFPPAGARVERLAETVALMKQYFAGECIDIAGTYVQAHGFDPVPAVVQSPRPPILIGGGAKRVLTLAGAEADIVSLNFNNRSGAVGADSVATSTADETKQKVEFVRAGAGERFDDIELEIAAYFLAIGDDIGSDVEALTARTGLPVEELRTFPHALVGTVEEICTELVRRREEYGISYVTVGDAAAESFAPVVARLTGT